VNAFVKNPKHITAITSPPKPGRLYPFASQAISQQCQMLACDADE